LERECRKLANSANEILKNLRYSSIRKIRDEVHHLLHTTTRIFYSIYPEKAEVHVLAIGIKIRERLYVSGKEVKR
jgi:hypothetical protein